MKCSLCRTIFLNINFSLHPSLPDSYVHGSLSLQSLYLTGPPPFPWISVPDQPLADRNSTTTYSGM